jgi:ligand-binding SRPBCC domain-containing protein
MPTSVFQSALSISSAELHAWHARPGAFTRLAPPWQRIEVLESARTLDPGARVRVRLRVGPFPVEWVAEHVEHVPGLRFRDVVRRGPFRRFDHAHSFLPDGEGRSVLEDRIGRLIGFRKVGRLAEPFAAQLARTFGAATGSRRGTSVSCEVAGGRKVAGCSSRGCTG